MWWHDGWGGGWFFMPLITLTFWVAVIWIVVSLLRSRPTIPPPARDTRSAARSDEILAQRYARGEIDDDEYRRRLNTLRGAQHHEGQP